MAKGKRTREIEDEICRLIADGTPLREICRMEGMPSWHAVYTWINQSAAECEGECESFSSRIARARELGFDAIAEDTIKMIDETPERHDTQFGTKVDPGHVQWQKNRVEQRLKLLAKWSPKRYGERQTIEHEGKLGLEALVAPEK
jgi:hypothetical protein